MDVRYYIDAETDQPHIYRHGVIEQEVEDVLRRPLEEIYVPDPQPDSVFVVTAYQLGPKALRALKRRRRRRR